MGLEAIVLSKVSQKEKYGYKRIYFICEIFRIYKVIIQYPTVTKTDNINKKLISYYIGFLIIGCMSVEGVSLGQW